MALMVADWAAKGYYRCRRSERQKNGTQMTRIGTDKQVVFCRVDRRYQRHLCAILAALPHKWAVRRRCGIMSAAVLPGMSARAAMGNRMSEFAVDLHQESNRVSPRRWVLSHLGRHGWLFAGMFIGAFGNAALAAAMPVFIGIAFDAALADPPQFDRIALAAVVVLASQVTRSVLQLGRNFASSVIGERMERDTRQELYLSLLGKSMTFHDLQPVGDTMARATNDVREMNLMMNPGINLVVGSANFMIMPMLLAPRYDPQLVAAPLFFIVAYMVALAHYMGILSHIADRVRLAFGSMNARLAEALDGVEMIKGSAQETAEIARFQDNAREYRNATAVSYTHLSSSYRG